MARSSRRRSVAAVGAALALVLAGCAEEESGGGDTGGGTASGPIKIGAVLDITGAGASLGVPERKTLEMLAKSVGQIGGREVQLIVEDNQSTEDGAAKAINKLLTQDKVDIVLGASRTGPSLAMRPIAESARIPMISLAANKAIVDGSRYVFKTAQNDSVVIENMIDLARQRGWKKLALARDASGFGEGVQETIDAQGKADGISVAVTEKFAPDATDFTAQMVNIRNARPDAAVIWGIPPAAALAQKAYKQLGIPAPVIQSHGIGNSVFLQTAGASADGLIAPLGRLVVADQLPDDDPQKKVITDFIAQYQAAYPGEAPSTFAGHAYDGWTLAIEAVKAVGTDKEKVRDWLESAKGVVGISGVFSMSPEDHSGLTKDALVLTTVKDSKFALLQPAG
jgi:branched-chain amino acid transport system substrate-binding protein